MMGMDGEKEPENSILSLWLDDGDIWMKELTRKLAVEVLVDVV